jgi:hypothetical protein
MLIFETIQLQEHANGLCYWALGRVWTLLGSRKNSKLEKCLKTAQNPQRPVHALLSAANLRNILYGFSAHCITGVTHSSNGLKRIP